MFQFTNRRKYPKKVVKINDSIYITNNDKTGVNVVIFLILSAFRVSYISSMFKCDRSLELKYECGR